MNRKVVPIAVALGSVLLLASLLAVVAWWVVALEARTPYWGELEPVFEASRVAHGLALYVDPLRGAFDYGVVPSRYYVCYPPIWSMALALVPDASRLVAARLLATGAWVAAVVLPVARARREARNVACWFAALILGSWVLANFASAGRPDSAAVLLVSIAVGRTLRRARLGLDAVALLVLAAFVKPTVIGALPGLLVAEVVVRPRSGARAWIAAAALVAASVASLELASHRMFWEHIVASNAQGFSLEALRPNLSRFLFFGPLGVWAFHTAHVRRTEPARLHALFALATSFGWTSLALAKVGSASNYWMEPCVIALLVVASFAPPPRPGRAWMAVLGLLAATQTALTSIRAAFSHAAEERRQPRAYEAIVRECGVADGGLVLSDHGGVELRLNGRVVYPGFQMSHAARAGRFPESLWAADVARPEVRCFVETDREFFTRVPAVARVVSAEFAPPVERAGLRVWTRRSSVSAP